MISRAVELKAAVLALYASREPCPESQSADLPIKSLKHFSRAHSPLDWVDHKKWMAAQTGINGRTERKWRASRRACCESRIRCHEMRRVIGETLAR